MGRLWALYFIDCDVAWLGVWLLRMWGGDLLAVLHWCDFMV